MGGTKKTARILSVNVSLPKEIDFEGQRMKTGIFKDPVEGRIRLKTLNLDGDRQADLAVHGDPIRQYMPILWNITNTGTGIIPI
jgi:MOSC domain-containing protein YiiM